MPSDTFLFKIVFSFGIFIALVGLIFPGANAAWNNVGVAIQSFPSLPNFPAFGAVQQVPTYQETQTVVANGHIGFGMNNVTPAVGGVPPPPTNGCSAANYWRCISNHNVTFGSWPGNAPAFSYASNFLQVGYLQNVSVQMSGFTVTQAAVTRITVNIICKTDVNGTAGSLANIAWFTPSDHLFFNYNPGIYICQDNSGGGLGTSYQAPLIDLAQNPAPLQADIFSNSFVVFQGGSGATADIAYFNVTLTINGQQACSASGSWWDPISNVACALWNGLINLAYPIIIVVNSIVYLIQGIFSILVFIGLLFVWIGNLFANVFVAMAVSMEYLFALPGAPQPIQWVVDAVAIVFILAFILAIADRVIGLFGGFVNKA